MQGREQGERESERPAPSQISAARSEQPKNPPPQIKGHEWRRGESEGEWNLWEVLQNDETGKKSRFVKTVSDPADNATNDMADDPGADHSYRDLPVSPTSGHGPSKSVDRSAKRVDKRAVTPADTSANSPGGNSADSTVHSVAAVPKIRKISDYKKKTSRTADSTVRRPRGRKPKEAQTGDRPPTISGFELRKADAGWIYWKLKLTPTNRRDKKGRIMYEKQRRYGIKIGRRSWAVIRRYDYETIIGIIAQRIETKGVGASRAGAGFVVAG